MKFFQWSNNKYAEPGTITIWGKLTGTSQRSSDRKFVGVGAFWDSYWEGNLKVFYIEIFILPFVKICMEKFDA